MQLFHLMNVVTFHTQNGDIQNLRCVKFHVYIFIISWKKIMSVLLSDLVRGYVVTQPVVYVSLWSHTTGDVCE